MASYYDQADWTKLVTTLAIADTDSSTNLASSRREQLERLIGKDCVKYLMEEAIKDSLLAYLFSPHMLVSLPRTLIQQKVTFEEWYTASSLYPDYFPEQLKQCGKRLFENPAAAEALALCIYSRAYALEPRYVETLSRPGEEWRETVLEDCKKHLGEDKCVNIAQLAEKAPADDDEESAFLMTLLQLMWDYRQEAWEWLKEQVQDYWKRRKKSKSQGPEQEQVGIAGSVLAYPIKDEPAEIKITYFSDWIKKRLGVCNTVETTISSLSLIGVLLGVTITANRPILTTLSADGRLAAKRMQKASVTITAEKAVLKGDLFPLSSLHENMSVSLGCEAARVTFYLRDVLVSSATISIAPGNVIVVSNLSLTGRM